MQMRPYRPLIVATALGCAATLMFAQTAKAQGGEKNSQKTQKPAPATVTADPGSTEVPKQISTGPVRLDNPQYGNVVFHTQVGSFKVLGSDPIKVEGKIEFSFRGTVLVSDLEAGSKLTIAGDVKKEYTTDDKTKEVYFGEGKMTVVGRFRSIQFFGQKLSGNFTGWGIFRFSGEFDKKLETGFYSVNGGAQVPWGTSINELRIGTSEPAKTEVKVKVRPKGG